MRIDTRLLKALRDLWQFRGRSIWVVLAMTLALGASFTLWFANYWVQTATRVQFLASLPVSATLHMDTLPPLWRSALAEVPGIAAARARLVLRASVQCHAAKIPALLFVLEDFQTRDLGQLQRVDGIWPPAANSWVIERSALEFTGLSMGDTCTFQRRDGTPKVALRLDGIAKDVSLPPGWMEHVVYGFIDSATAQRLGAPVAFDELQLRVQDNARSRDQVRAVAQLASHALQRLGAEVRRIEVPEPNTHEHARQIDSLMLVQSAFALFALLFSAFLIANLMTSVLAQQLRDIAIMKALGAEFSWLWALTLSQAAVLGLLAGLVAIPGAYLLGLRYGELRVAMLNFDLQGLSPPIAVALQQAAIALLLPMLAAAWPVWRGLRASTQAALCENGFANAPTATRSQNEAGRFGFVWRGMTWLRRNRPLALTLDNTLRKPARLWLTLLAIASGGAVFLAAHNLRVAVQASVAKMYEAANYDVSLDIAEPAVNGALSEKQDNESQQSTNLMLTLHSMSLVAKAELWGSGSVDWRPRTEPTMQTAEHDDHAPLETMNIIALPENSRLFQPKAIEGTWFKSDAGLELVISRSLAKTEPAWRLGAVLPLSINGKVALWRVMGIVDTGPQRLLYTSAAAWAAVSGQAAGRRLVIQLAPPPNARVNDDTWQIDALMRIRDKLTQAGIAIRGSQRMVEARRIGEDHLLMVVNFLGMMGPLMLLIGGMGLVSTLGLSVLERRQEIALMRALGASDRAVSALVLSEALLMALMAFFLALPVSVPISLGLGMAFSAIMFEVPNRYLPIWSASLLWFVFSIGLAVLAAYLPARSARQIGR